ncbi:MAG: Holliday junction branch migration protein RuvA [bacterium]|nr:Holliday junction branch migration protein RuvA [bacterium]
MIGWIKGRLVEVLASEALIDVGGVGYALLMGPAQLLELKSRRGEEVERYVVTLMREDSLRLFGFPTALQRELFDKLLGVSGVGPKAAMAILDLFEPDQLVFTVENQDERPFTQVPGIGKKTAQRILLDLKGKLKDLGGLSLSAPTRTIGIDNGAVGHLSDARSALINLGFADKEADRVLKKFIGSEVPLDELIRLALAELKQKV